MQVNTCDMKAVGDTREKLIGKRGPGKMEEDNGREDE